MPANILVVDDRFETVAMLTRLLQERGYGVWWSRTCREAKAVAATYPIDVLISAVKLPDGDGGELVSALRGIYSRMRGIAWVHSAEEMDHASLTAAGFQAVLIEPMQASDIQQALAATVAARQPGGLSTSAPSTAIICM